MPEHPGHIAPGAPSNSTVETDGSPARQTDYHALPDDVPVLTVTGCDSIQRRAIPECRQNSNQRKLG